MPSLVGVSQCVRLEHLARGAGVLAIGFIVEIAPADRRDVQERGEHEEET